MQWGGGTEVTGDKDHSKSLKIVAMHKPTMTK